MRESCRKLDPGSGLTKSSVTNGGGDVLLREGLAAVVRGAGAESRGGTCTHEARSRGPARVIRFGCRGWPVAPPRKRAPFCAAPALTNA